jgi:hypothetical protein
MYVTDFLLFRILKVDRDGHMRGQIGSIGKETGSFSRPRGIAFDKLNRLYVVDAAFQNLQVFTKEGQLLLFFGKSGVMAGELYLPAKVFIDYDDVKYFQQYADPNFEIQYLIFVTSQFGIRPVTVYGFGTMKGQAYKTDEELLKEVKEKEEKRLKEQQDILKKAADGNPQTTLTAPEKPGDSASKTAPQENQGQTGDADQKKD